MRKIRWFTGTTSFTKGNIPRGPGLERYRYRSLHSFRYAYTVRAQPPAERPGPPPV